MWWTLLTVAALTGGLLDFCTEQLKKQLVLPESSTGSPGISSGESLLLPEWTTSRTEFEPSAGLEAEKASALVSIYGGRGTWLTSAPGPQETWDAVSFEFWNSSPGGWVEFMNRADVVDCKSGEPVALLGDAALLVHLEGAFLDEEFIENDVQGETVLDLRRVCDQDGVLEWAIGLKEAHVYRVDFRPFSESGNEFRVMRVEVLD
jgi:hypothetical protein